MSARIWYHFFLLLFVALSAPANGGTGPRPPINADNAAQIQQIAVIGRGHLNDVDWSPDARSIAIGSDIGIWVYDSDLAEGFLIDNVTDSITVLDFSQDGSILAVGDAGGKVYFFDAIHMSLIKDAALGDGPIQDLALQADGTRIGVSFPGNTALLEWPTLNGYQLHDEGVSSISISADGEFIAFPVYGGFGVKGDVVELYDAHTGQQVTAWEPGFHVRRIAFNPAGDRLLVAAADGEIGLWSVPEGIPILAFSAFSASLNDAAWSPDGTRIAATTTNPFGSDGNDVLIFDTTTGDEVARLASHTSITAVAFSPDGARLGAVTAADTIQLWDAHSGDDLGRLDNPWGAHALAFSPDSETLAAACGHSIRLYETINWVQRTPLESSRRDENISVLSYLPDGRIVTGSHIGSGGGLGHPSPIRLWDPETGHSTIITEHDPSRIGALAVSPDGTQIASVGAKTRITPIDGGTDVILAERATIQVLAFSPNGTLLATGSAAGSVQLWDSNGQLVQTLTDYTGLQWNPVHALAFSVDGALLVSTSYKRLRVHDVASGPEHWSWNHLANITDLAVSPDGSLLVIAAEDGVLHFYTLATGIWLAERADSFKAIDELVFSPDGTLLVGNSNDGTLHVWAASR